MGMVSQGIAAGCCFAAPGETAPHLNDMKEMGRIFHDSTYEQA
jgi:hypothetical protein